VEDKKGEEKGRARAGHSFLVSLFLFLFCFSVLLLLILLSLFSPTFRPDQQLYNNSLPPRVDPHPSLASPLPGIQSACHPTITSLDSIDIVE